MKLQCLKLFIMIKTKKNQFLEDFREISFVGSLKSVQFYMYIKQEGYRVKGSSFSQSKP